MVEIAKGSYWKSIRIYDFFQLSRAPFKFNVGLVGASLYFWFKLTHNFHFQYSMMGPTLFDVTAITSLSSLEIDIVTTIEVSKGK